MKKKAQVKIIGATILILTALINGFMFLNIGDRFINHGGVYSKYHLLESAYLIETVFAYPSIVEVNYPFDLTEFNYDLSGNEYTVISKGFDSDKYILTYTKGIKFNIGPFDLNNFISRSSEISFSKNKINLTDHLCPYYNSTLKNPKIVVALYNLNDTNYDDLYSYYTEVNKKSSNVFFINLKNKEIDITNDFSIIVSDNNNHDGILIYYNPNLMNIKFSCLLFNEINKLFEHDINLVLIPSYVINSDIQIKINFEDNNINSKRVLIPIVLSKTLEDFFK
jgi:hypothetical protein